MECRAGECPRCGATNPDEAAEKCQPSEDWCPGCDQFLLEEWDRQRRIAEHMAYETLARYYESKGGMQVSADLVRLGEVEGTMTTRECLSVLAFALLQVKKFYR